MFLMIVQSSKLLVHSVHTNAPMHVEYLHLYLMTCIYMHTEYSNTPTYIFMQMYMHTQAHIGVGVLNL